MTLHFSYSISRYSTALSFSLSETLRISWKLHRHIVSIGHRHVVSIGHRHVVGIHVGHKARETCQRFDLEVHVPDYKQVAAGGDGVALTYAQLLHLKFNWFQLDMRYLGPLGNMVQKKALRLRYLAVPLPHPTESV